MRPPPTSRLFTILTIRLLAGCQARAGGGGGGSAKGNREFNGHTAFTYVAQQMAFGPRIPNTAGHEKMGDWLLTTLRARADTVAVQDFRWTTHKGANLHMRNFF